MFIIYWGRCRAGESLVGHTDGGVDMIGDRCPCPQREDCPMDHHGSITWYTLA